MGTLAENLCYLLWRQEVPRAAWAERLAGWAECDRGRAEALLRGASVAPEELTRVSLATGVTEEELACSRLVVADGVNLLLENLKFLLQDVEHGQKGSLAERLHVHPSTLSKWCVGKQRPERKKLLPLCDCLGVEVGTDLEQETLFLRPGPVGDGQRRRWLHTHIDRLSPELLRNLFPALERLLEER